MPIISSVLRGLRIVKPLPKKEPININKDTKAIIDFLINMDHDRERLLRLFKKFLEIRLEFHALTDSALRIRNLRHQVSIFDEIIQVYSFYQGDTDINGKRVKEIAKAMRIMAVRSQEPDLIDKTSKLRWRFDW